MRFISSVLSLIAALLVIAVIILLIASFVVLAITGPEQEPTKPITMQTTQQVSNAPVSQAGSRVKEILARMQKLQQSTASPYSDDNEEVAEACENIVELQALRTELKGLIG